MRRSFCAATIAVCVLSSLSYGTNYLVIKPTTTLAAQTANNTSAVNSFTTQSNGNLGAGNVSKESVRSLLYPGANTKIYAHLMVWFGGSNHMNVGYSSTDAAQVKRQIDDMVSRGIDGVIIDWYGSNNSEDQATQLVMAEAEKHPGFAFAIMVDKGAIQWNSCSGCSPQQALIQHLQYVEQNYFPSPAYLRIGGRPVVTNFDIDLSYAIDWNAVNASLATSPAFLFQNNSGFAHVLSSGSYAWVIPSTTDFGASYLKSFYATGTSFPGSETVGAAYKGFNDTLASWGSNRIMSQQCGQTWLQTFSLINGLYNSSKPLSSLQLVTWNDYEEGTEIESGIDNCVSLTGSVASGSLQWSVKGSESTIDHYTTYVSADGQNLMPLTDLATGSRSVNLCSYALAPGKYSMFVQAVGKPSFRNFIAGPFSYTPQCGGTTTGIDLKALPSTLTLNQGMANSTQISVIPQSTPFNSPVSLSCSGLPAGVSCSFSPAIVTPGSATGTSTLTVTSSALASSQQPPEERGKRGLAYLFTFAAGLVVVGTPGRRRVRKIFFVPAVLCLTLFCVSCGGGQSRANAFTPTSATYTLSIDGSAGSIQASVPLTITIHQ